jgi:hypothetical protein
MKSKWINPLPILLLGVVTLVGISVGGYFIAYVMRTIRFKDDTTGRGRVYRTGYEAHIFGPAAKFESILVGRPTGTVQAAPVQVIEP